MKYRAYDVTMTSWTCPYLKIADVYSKTLAKMVNFAKNIPNTEISSGLGNSVARAFPGGRVAHPASQNEEENEKNLRKKKKKWSKLGEILRKVELLPTRDCAAGYGPGFGAYKIMR